MIKAKLSKFKSFSEAKDYVHRIGLKSNQEWRVWAKGNSRPIDIPGSPEKVYSSEWISWGDWLGTKSVAFKTRKLKSFEDARQYIHV